MNFDKYAQDGKEFVNKVAFELGDEADKSRASRLLRATLHTLRDQSSPEESMQLVSQLPILIKAVFVDGWRIGSHKGHVRTLEDFIDGVERNGGFSDDGSDSSKHQQIQSIRSVLRVVREYVSEGEFSEFRLTLPESIRILLDD